jgi:O-antigen ligase
LGAPERLPTIRRVFLATLPRYIAFAWGALVFTPLGLNYLAFLLLLLAFALDKPQWGLRWQRLRSSRVAQLMAAVLAITVLTLVWQPKFYAETGSNLFHGWRIACTLWLALALSRDEAVFALRGFALACIVSLLVVVTHAAIGLPKFGLWNGLIAHDGNKSISNALLFGLASGACLTLAKAVWATNWRRGVAWVAMAAATLTVVLAALPSRTALIGWLLAMALVAAHQWRGQWLRLALVSSLIAAAGAGAYGLSPAVQQRFEIGVSELQLARSGAVVVKSWVVRYQMYTQTGQMIAERPLAGWGVGAWNEEWRKRMPDAFDDFNMPHNDFLWLGAQSGVLALFLLGAIFVVGIWQAWRTDTLAGRLALMAWVSMAVATSFNSATRDAAIGLSFFWMCSVMLRLKTESIEARAPLARSVGQCPA